MDFSQVILSLHGVLVALMFVYQLAKGELNGTGVSMEEIVEQLFREDRYNRNIRPTANEGKSSEVAVGLYLQSLSSVSELKMEYTIDIYFRLFWNDPRLAFNGTDYLTVDSFWKGKIWLPDPYFMNSKDEHFHTVTLPNIMIRIYPSGDIFFSQRLSLTLSCNMDLRKFPMDTQVCDVRIMSYAFNTRDIVLVWRSVEKDETVELPEYDVSEDTVLGDCTQTYISGKELEDNSKVDDPRGGIYSCLVAKFSLTRRLSFYMVQTYIPSILIVVLSWVNFWLDPHATPARVSLGLLCVLTMTTQNSGILSTLPRVSYVKSIDVWSSACLVFVFGALIEFAVVNVQTRKQEIWEKKMASKLANIAPSNGVVEVSRVPEEAQKDTHSCLESIYFTAVRVDLLSRILFPSAFLIFNLVYWNLYLK